MGFFDSLLKSAARRAVNGVVDKTVDKAVDGAVSKIFGDNHVNDNRPAQAQTPQPIERINRPDLSGEEVVYSCTYFDPEYMNKPFKTNDPEWAYVFEKSPYLFQFDSGVSELDVSFYCANSQAEVDSNPEGKGLPAICFGDDLCSPDRMQNKHTTVIRTPILNHSNFIEKYELDCSEDGEYACGYRFYPVADNRNPDTIRDMSIDIPKGCSTDLRIKAIKSFELIAATLRMEYRVVPFISFYHE